MVAPIPPEKAEELVFHYVCLHEQLRRREIAKLSAPLKDRAEQLGFSLRSAWRIIRFAREIEMIDIKAQFK